MRHLSASRTETPEGSPYSVLVVCVCKLKNVCEAASKASGTKGEQPGVDHLAAPFLALISAAGLFGIAM